MSIRSSSNSMMSIRTRMSLMMRMSMRMSLMMRMSMRISLMVMISFFNAALLSFSYELCTFSHTLLNVFFFSIHKVAVLFEQNFDHIPPTLGLALVIVQFHTVMQHVIIIG